MNRIQSLFSLLILSMLLYNGLYSFLSQNQNSISEQEKRELKVNQDLIETSFLSSEFISTFESIITDQFQNRYYFVNMKNSINYSFINVALHGNKNPFILKRIGDSPIFRIGDTEYLTPFPIQYDRKIEQRLIDRAEQINRLASDFPDVEFYVYKPTQIFETDFFDQANQIESAGIAYDQVLRNHLNVPYDSFEFYTFSDFPKYQYFSDHHWNHEGINRGYQEIVELLLGTEEELLLPQEENCFNELTFSGTYTSLSGFITSGAPFCVFRYDLPEYIYWVNGKFRHDIQDTNAYFHKEVQDNMANHYENAYNLGSGIVEVQSNSDRKETLLIIGDSYAPPVVPLLAKHFNHIYIVTPIRYAQVFGYDFTYDDFIKEHSIDSVLFMYVIDNYFVSDEWGERYKSFDVHRTEN